VERTIWSFTSENASDALKKRNDCAEALRDHLSASSLKPYTLAQIYGELVSNVIRHAPGRIAVTLQLGAASATLTVTDSGRGVIPLPSLPLDPYSECGRGLFIAAHLAASIRIERSPEGRVSIGAVLPLTAGELSNHDHVMKAIDETQTEAAVARA
jgi:anti-sigma regulatory factor (Ser/Thr protein kinase)